MRVTLYTEKYMEIGNCITAIYENGFVIKHNTKKYIVTLHHNLPINKVIDENKNELEIIINSNWNELLFLKLPDDISDIPDYNIYINNFQTKLPKKSDIAHINIDGTKFKIDITNITYFPFDNINGYKLPYIECCMKDNVSLYTDNNEKLIGSPVFIDNKMIGIYSRTNTSNIKGYIIPTYTIIKTLSKIDNNNIYTIPNLNNISKIGKFNINNNLIYHQILKQNINIDSYIMLEGDKDKILRVKYKDTTKGRINMIVKQNLLDIGNYLVIKEDKYKLNLRLLTLIKKTNPNMIVRIMRDLIQSKEDIWI